MYLPNTDIASNPLFYTVLGGQEFMQIYGPRQSLPSLTVVTKTLVALQVLHIEHACCGLRHLEPSEQHR
jgi:hypothetical protein